MKISKKELQRRINISKSLIGRSLSEDHEKKVSESMRKRWENPKLREKMSMNHKGKKLSNEHKNKISNGGIQKSYPTAVGGHITNLALLGSVAVAGTININLSYWVE